MHTHTPVLHYIYCVENSNAQKKYYIAHIVMFDDLTL